MLAELKGVEHARSTKILERNCAVADYVRYLGSVQLPPKVQADLFRQQIVESSRNHNPAGVIDAAEGYRALATQGIQVPPGVLYLEATAAEELGDPLRAFDALTSYLKVASSADIYYRDALHLYPLYAADPAVKARAAAKPAEPQKITKEKTGLTRG